MDWAGKEISKLSRHWKKEFFESGQNIDCLTNEEYVIRFKNIFCDDFVMTVFDKRHLIMLQENS